LDEEQLDAMAFGPLGQHVADQLWTVVHTEQ
jgi:hypothetical protein